MIFNVREKVIVKYEKYWDIHFSSKIQSETIAKNLVLEKLDSAVKKRMIADVPVGAFLSGGVDSSAIVSIMSKYTRNLNTFSIKFDYEDYDESKYADIVSQKFKTHHHVIEFNATHIKNLIPKLVYHYDEPFGDHSMIPTFLVSKVAKEYVTVSLSGDGGDEIFGGYSKYQHFQYVRAQNIIRPITRLLSNIIKQPKILHRYLRYSSLEEYEQFANLSSYAYIENLTKNGIECYDIYKNYFIDKNWLNNAINSDLHIYLPEDILTKVDRASLASSLESRPPFLDHEMIELACSLSPSLKIKKGEKKYILKKAMEGILPKKIIYRKKKGFGSPIKHYFKNELKNLIFENVVKYNEHKYFDNINRKLLFEEHVSGKEDHSRILWSMLMFNEWWNMWMVEK